MSSNNSDPLEVARAEYRKLLKRTREAESDQAFLRHVIESAMCVVNGDGLPEKLSDHPLVGLVLDQRRQPTELKSEIMRLRNLLSEVLLLGTAGGVASDRVWSRLLSEIRDELAHKKDGVR